MTTEEQFMARALELASRGLGAVSPNPLVGCVIVRDGKIIGEGWHQKHGKAHAEVNAVLDTGDESLVTGSDLYVTLEPCAHTGKTPPCADLLVRLKPRRVVIAHTDPNPLVSGKGIGKLTDAGIEVLNGVLESQARHLNRRFLRFMTDHRPYIILKWAQTADRLIARENLESKWISGTLSRALVHRWRAEEDAVLVGTRTAIHDNPLLTVRDWTGRNPVRIVVDRFLRLPQHLHLLDGAVRTIVYNVLRHEEKSHLLMVRLDENDFLSQLLGDLHRRDIQSVIVEGGAFTLQQFIDSGHWDEARIFESARTFGKGVDAPQLRGQKVDSARIGDDELSLWVPQRSTWHLVSR